jgi:hypothetical protein
VYGATLQQQWLVPCSCVVLLPGVDVMERGIVWLRLYCALCLWLHSHSAPGSLKLPVFTNSTPFYYPLVGSWGTLAFPKQWEQFLHWFRQLRVHLTTPSIDSHDQARQLHHLTMTMTQTEEPLFRPYINGTMPSRWFRGKQARLPLV